MTVLAKVNNNAPTVPNLSSWFDDWFGRDYPTLFSNSGFNQGWNTPPVNITESPESYLLEFAIPGMKKSDFNIHLDNGLLTVSCEMETKNDKSEETYTRREFSFRSFKRTFTLLIVYFLNISLLSPLSWLA